MVETVLYAHGRDPARWLAGELHAPPSAESPWPHAVAELAARLADREPPERPEPGNADAVTWRIPGPGGHVRHYVAMALAGDDPDPALKRDVVFGFVVRCCEEAIANPDLYVYNS